MSGFSADWLALREPLDACSRAHGLAEELREQLSGIESIRILDLATGTGANLRYLAPRLGGRQEWLLIDNDPSLLDALPAAMRTWASDRGFSMDSRTLRVNSERFQADIRIVRVDLARDLDRLPVSGCHLVTASALLDLVSEPWLEALADRSSTAGASLLFSHTYDGLIELDPPEPEDSEVRDLVNRHQRKDKGFGAALGPAASATAENLLVSRGFGVRTATSDWHIKPDDRAVQKALLAGWAEAASETTPHSAARLRHWRRRRESHVDVGGSRMTVGHLDLLAFPGPMPDAELSVPKTAGWGEE
jgi:hypothetical protein